MLFRVKLRICSCQSIVIVGYVSSQSQVSLISGIIVKCSRGCSGSHSWLPAEHNNAVREVSCHNKIVLDNKCGAFCMQNISKSSLSRSPPIAPKSATYRLITLLAMIRCSESKNEDGSSNKYTSAGLPIDTILLISDFHAPVKLPTEC